MITKYFRLFLFFFLIGNLLISCKNKSISTRLVSVSILPQKYLTEQIAGDYLTVNVMIPPGMNPATCDLSTEQLKKLYDSDLCFTIGYLPFEQIHLFPVLENRPDIQIVNHSANLQLIHGSCGHTHAAGDEHDGVDPHIWLSPAHARTMATTVYEVLSEKYPEQKLQFEQNYQALLQKIDSIADRAKQVLDHKKDKIFLIYHPALTYFAADYGMEQISIEDEGKEPNPAHLKKIIDLALEKNIHMIFIQSQFDVNNAESVAKQIGGQIIQIDPLTAPFVLEAFKRYDGGETISSIMNWLNEQGLTNTRGRKMTFNSVGHILHNRRYIGEFRYRDVIVPDGIPAIVPQDLFDRVQEKLAKNKKAPARHKAEDDYLLTTKLFCGMCGAMMFGECGTGRNKVVHHYYKCATAKRFKTCKKKTVRKEWLEDLVIAETMKLIQDDAVIDAIVAEVMELQDQENTTLPLLEKQMREVENGIENMLNAIQAGVLTNSTKSRLEKLEAQQKELEVRIAEEKIARPRLSENQVRFWLTRFRKLDPNVKSHRETLINTFVNAVYLYDEKVLITFNYKDGTKTITFDEIAAKDAPEGNGSDLGCFAPPKKFSVRKYAGLFVL